MKYFLLFTLGIFLNSCATQNKGNEVISDINYTSSKIVNATYPTDNAPENHYRISENQNIFIKDLGLNITFLRTIKDNRCPINVQCIRAGAAQIELELMSTVSRPQKVILTVGDKLEGGVESIEFSGIKVKLTNLYPGRYVAKETIDLKGHYLAELQLEKITTK